MIEFESVGKKFRDGTAAVVNLDLTVPSDKITVIVGPSGCGKTTTLRMVNRMLEPTSGRIVWDGSPLRSKRKTRLRRQMGYVIQSGGLFPHRTVLENIGTVPGLLGWDKTKTRKRSQELLQSVGLDRKLAHRYPGQLSGGQQQRVGVARALAADPPVLLMDEPFGAVDPITRGLLQDELMRLQAELGKTIVFVTHDFGEAVKLGDRIAVLGDRSTVLQYDTPEAILANPADDTVAAFIGAGASLKQLTLLRVRDVELEQRPTARLADSVDELRLAVGDRRGSWGIVLDDRGRPYRWVAPHHLANASSLDNIGIPIGETVSTQSTLQDALEALLAESNAATAVTGSRGEYVGMITIDTLVGTIRSLREEHEHDHDNGRNGTGSGDTGSGDRAPQGGAHVATGAEA